MVCRFRVDQDFKAANSINAPISTGWCSMYQVRLQRPNHASGRSAVLSVALNRASALRAAPHCPSAMPHHMTAIHGSTGT